jgi:hypothetical protein
MADNSNQNPILAEDEILIRDENGEFKILKGDSLLSLANHEEARANQGVTIEGLISKIIRESGLVLKNNLEKRLEEIVIARLKDIRDDNETRLILANKIPLGGLELNESEANKLIEVIKNQSKKGEVIDLLQNTSAAKVFTVATAPEAPVIRPVSKQQTPKRTMDFYPEDEDEIVKIKQQMGPAIKLDSKNKINEIIKNLIFKFNLSFANADTKSRLEKAILSRLKDIRDELETRETLVRKMEEGGVGLGDAEADKIIMELRNIRNKISKPLSTNDVSHVGGARQPVRLPSPQIVSRDQNVSKPAPRMIAPPHPAIVKSTPKKESTPLPQMRRPTEDDSAKKQVVDVRFIPKLFGPTQELAALTLIDFRRLSKDPKIAIQKIIDKINLLEEESFRQKIDGIRSWQMSEVYKLYSNIGKMSLIQEKPIKQVMDEMMKQGKPALTDAEFGAIMELNKMLRF